MLLNTLRKSAPLLTVAGIMAMLILLGAAGCSDDDGTCPEPGDPPRVTGHYPADGDTLVEPDTFLTVTFDMEMDPATVSIGSFTLEGPLGPVGASVSLDSAMATLTPFELLAGRSTYTARIGAGVSSMEGTPMGVDYAWTFTTDRSSLMLYPNIEFTVRDSDGDSSPDSIYVGGPPGRYLMMGELGAAEDRAVMEFSLDGIVHDEVLEAIVFITVYDVSSESVPVRMEGWGYTGEGAAGTSDWSGGFLIAGRDLADIRSGTTFAFAMTDAINSALAAGASHVGFRVHLTGGPHAQIYTTNDTGNAVPRLVLLQ